MIKVEGKLTKADVPNLNGHVYPREVMEKAIEQLREDIEAKRVLGRVGTQQPPKMRINDASHMVVGLRMEDDRLQADIEVLDTPRGRILQQWLDAKLDITLHPTWLAELDGNTVREGARLLRLDVCPYSEATGG